MDKDSFDVSEQVRDFNLQLRKVTLPPPLPPVNFEFKETSSGVEGSAYTEDLSFLDMSAFTDDRQGVFPKKYGVIRNIPGVRTAGTTRFPEMTSNTAYELDVRKTAVEMMTKEMTRKIEEHYRLTNSKIFQSLTSYEFEKTTLNRDSMDDALKYSMSALFKMPVIKPMDVVKMDIGWDDRLPVTPLEKPEGPTQLELF